MSHKKKTRKKYRGFWIFIRIQVVLILLVLGAIAYYFLGGYATTVKELSTEAKKLVRESTEDTFQAIQTGVLYDASGTQIALLKGEKDVYYLDSDEIPLEVKMAIISIEDKKFYRHKGIDYKAIIRAAWAMVRNGEVTQGGSTITQQLARTVFLNNNRTWQRKMEEIFIATGLEKKYSKSKLLEFYLNNIYFGNGYYGIQAASRGYFNRDVDELNLTEIAFLCAIPNNPTLYDPVTNYENTIKRRNRILDNMVEDGSITEAAGALAKAEEVTLDRPAKTKNNYVETYAYYCAVRVLMEMQGFTFQTDFATTEERDTYEKDYQELYDTCERALYTAIPRSIWICRQCCSRQSTRNWQSIRSRMRKAFIRCRVRRYVWITSRDWSRRS